MRYLVEASFSGMLTSVINSLHKLVKLSKVSLGLRR